MGSGQRFAGLIARFAIILLVFIAVTAELLHLASLPLGYGHSAERTARTGAPPRHPERRDYRDHPSSVYGIDKDDVSALLELRPEIADEFGRVFATREHARLALPDGGAAVPESVLEHFTSQIAALFNHR